jgi:hypothetical protein
MTAVDERVGERKKDVEDTENRKTRSFHSAYKITEQEENKEVDRSTKNCSVLKHT